MPKAKPSFSPLQLVSPVQLLFCLVLFFLPWIEMQCVMPASEVKNIPKNESEKMKKELGIDPTKPVSMVSQTGLQIATGSSSPGSDMKKIESKMKEDMKKMGGTVEETKGIKNDKDDVKGAPLLFLFPVLVVVGIVVALVPLPPTIRRIAVAGCCAGALAVVGLQAALGFPMENEIKKKSDEMKALGGGGFGFGGGGGGMAPPGDKGAKAESKGPEFRVSWKFPLYLTFLFLIGAAGTAFLDGLGGGGGRARSGRKGRRDDYDDDWDDDEDDRPRKKRRRDEDDYDDEDDRPRKKKAAEPMSLDDEDDRPRKKSRRDEDEDEDDRPRKKKPVEPEFDMPAPPPAAPEAPAGGNPFDFDSQEQPKKKPRRRDDEDDDRPPKRR